MLNFLLAIIVDAFGDVKDDAGQSASVLGELSRRDTMRSDALRYDPHADRCDPMRADAFWMRR